MSSGNDRSWMRLPQQAEEWQKGFKKFIDHKFGGTLRGEMAPCHARDVVQCPTKQLTKLDLICFIEAFLKVLSYGKEKKKIHLGASVKGLTMKVEPVTVIL